MRAHRLLFRWVVAAGLPMAAMLALFLLSGCASVRSREEVNPAPSAYATIDEAYSDAMFWASRSPMRRVFTISNTGSMVPWLDSHAIIGCEAVLPQDVKRNDIVIYLRNDGVLVCHQVNAVWDGYFLFSGVNNKRSDGWIEGGAIGWRIAAIFYSQRNN